MAACRFKSNGSVPINVATSRSTVPCSWISPATACAPSTGVLEGLTIPAYPGTLPNTGTTHTLRLTLPFQGFDIGFDTPATVAAGGAFENAVHFEFTDLGARERDLMSHFISELLRGSMVPVDDTIQRIDVPVLPVQTTPDAPPPGLKSAISQPVRAAGMTALYGTVGLLTFGYLGSLFYHAMFKLEVPTATVSAPIETVTAQGEGYATLTALKAGDVVKEGDVIVRLFDNALERDIEHADIAVREREAKLAFLVQRQENEEQRLVGFAALDKKNTAQIRISIESLHAQIRLAEQEYRGIPPAITPGVSRSGPAAQAEVKRRILNLKKTLETKELEIGSRQALTKAGNGARIYTGRAIVGDSEDIGAQVALAAQEIEFAKQKHDSLLRHRDRLAARAPFDGTIVEIPQLDKGSVRKGDVLAVIEQNGPRQVTAFLSQDEVSRLRLGDSAQLQIPALGATIPGQVAVIDRTSGINSKERDRQNGPAHGARLRGPQERTAKVTLTIADEQWRDGLNRMRAGLPAVVVFEKRTQTTLASALSRRIADGGSGRKEPTLRALQTTVAPTVAPHSGASSSACEPETLMKP